MEVDLLCVCRGAGFRSFGEGKRSTQPGDHNVARVGRKTLLRGSQDSELSQVLYSMLSGTAFLPSRAVQLSFSTLQVVCHFWCGCAAHSIFRLHLHRARLASRHQFKFSEALRTRSGVPARQVTPPLRANPDLLKSLVMHCSWIWSAGPAGRC